VSEPSSTIFFGHALTPRHEALTSNYRILFGVVLGIYALSGLYLQDYFYPPTEEEGKIKPPVSVKVVDKAKPQPS